MALLLSAQSPLLRHFSLLSFSFHNSLIEKKRKKMLMGKRPRPPMKRTTSMNEITFDLNTTTAAAEPPPSDPHNPFINYPEQPAPALFGGVWGPQIQPNGVAAAAAPVSTRIHRRHSADFMETPPFLRSCGLCKHRLVPGRDVYMYRGDAAFCSLECRQQQMKQDDKRKKCPIESIQETSPDLFCRQIHQKEGQCHLGLKVHFTTRD